MRKINIGSGIRWKKPGWEILDNGRGSYRDASQHFGVIWDTGLPSETYDIVFTSHTLEHIPHFMIEKTIAEINRILRIGGILRISVPDLEKAVKAYVEKDRAYFFNEDTIHPSDHLGFGSMLLNQIISPGQQTIALNRDFEPIGGYGHTYNYDFEMLQILLGKWGFENIVHSSYCESRIEELREPNTIVCDGTSFPVNDTAGKQRLKSDPQSYVTGFDNKPGFSLFVEAEKTTTIPYDMDLEFPYTQRNRLTENRLWRLKSKLFRPVNACMDQLYHLYLKLRERL